MDPVLSHCGYRCDLCLAYKPNVERDPSNRQKLSDGWFKYFGFRIQPENIICDGCMVDSPQMIDQSCPVRPCVLSRGLENCSQCDEYSCERLNERLVVYEAVRDRIGVEIPEDDFQCFIRPFENKRRLEALRAVRAASQDI